MKEKLLSKGYKIWKKNDGNERIYINNLMQYLTIVKTEKSSKNEIDIYEDYIENIKLNDLNKETARQTIKTLKDNTIKLYYSISKEKFCWSLASSSNKSLNNVVNELVTIIISKLRSED